MLEANIRMAHQLGMWTVAEGVEDLDDWTLLRELRSDFAQGYFIARPMPGDAIPGWLGEWEVRRQALTA
jgi:EAL domain-containing protein (putative c-di-GMP-specific phosphodiesterase class I)